PSHVSLKYSAPFFVNDTPTTEIYTLSLHDALPIFDQEIRITLSAPDQELISRHFLTNPDEPLALLLKQRIINIVRDTANLQNNRSEEHTSELQSRENLVCRLLLEKKKHTDNNRANA